MHTNAALLQRIQSLSPDKQALLLRRLAESVRSEGGDPIFPHINRDAPAPLSYSQQLLWLVEQREGPSAKYNMPSAYRLVGRLDADAMVRTLRTIVRRHESLRTYFRDSEGDPVQCVDDTFELDVPVIDLCDLAADERDRQVQALVQQNVDWCFDVGSLPLARFVLLRTAVDEHFLLMNVHHIVYDGWSKGLLLQEMAVLYPAYGAGRDAQGELPLLPIQYRDYAAWQRVGQLAEIERQLGYWTRKLEGALPLLHVPGDRPRPPQPSGRGAGLMMHVPRFLSEQVETLARSEGASMYMAMLAMFKVLLARLSGQRDIVVGSPVDNRSRSELQQVIGYFLNTSVLRSDIDVALSFREVLARVRQTCVEAYQYQDVALGQVIDAVNPLRSLSFPPLFQVMFVFQNAGSANFSLPGIAVSRADAESSTSKYDLYLSFQTTADGLKGWWTYNTDLYDQATIEHFSACLLGLLVDAVSDPDKPAARLLMADRDDAEPIPAAPESVPFESLPDRFVRQARATPEAPALIDATGPVSYADLLRRVAGFTVELRACGVGRGDVVAVRIDRSVDQVAALVAIAACGAASLALDPALPLPRTAFLLDDAAPRVLVGDAAGLACTLAVIDPAAVADADPQRFDVVEVGPCDLLYLLYTSGSTGTPKGVRGTAGATFNRLDWGWRAYPFAADDVCCLKTTVNFVDAVAELWSPLLCGIPAVLVGHDDVRDPYRFVRVLAAHRVTRLVAVPSLLRNLVEAYPELHESLPTLRHVVSSGEALTGELVERLRAALPHLQLVNLYGSTEVAADVTAYEVAERHVGGVPVGRPIDHVSAHVVDPVGHRCAHGVAGELMLGGAGVNDGYHGRPALTAERFVPDPFAQGRGGRLFRSGDLARCRRDGVIELLGRADHQVKVRGVRIELDEIRSALLACRHVADALVALQHDERGEPYLGAYVVPPEDQLLDTATLAAELRERLPDYLMPAAFMPLERIPLNANGKLDRDALPPIPRSMRAGGRVHVPPVGDTETTLATIWQERLQVERVGRDENFFDLGGHSLIATRIVSAVRERFGVELSARDLFATMTVEAFARRIDAVRAASGLLVAAESSTEYEVSEY